MFLNEVPGLVSRLLYQLAWINSLLVDDLSKNEPSNVPAAITFRIIKNKPFRFVQTLGTERIIPR